jgi:hypothetical protein
MRRPGAGQAAFGLGDRRSVPEMTDWRGWLRLARTTPARPSRHLLDGRGVGAHRGHDAGLAGGLGDDAAPLGHEQHAGGVVRDEAAGRRGRELAQRVPQHQVGDHARDSTKRARASPRAATAGWQTSVAVSAAAASGPSISG